MFSLLIGLVYLGYLLLNNVEPVLAIGSALNVTWWTYLITTILVCLLTLIVFTLGVRLKKNIEAYSMLFFGMLIHGGLGMLGLTLICKGYNPTDVHSNPMLVVGTFLFLWTCLENYNLGTKVNKLL